MRRSCPAQPADVHSAPYGPCPPLCSCRWPWRICGSSCASASNYRSPLRSAGVARGAAAGGNTRQAATFACTATDSASFPLHIVAHSTMFPISYTAFCIRFIQQCTFSVRDLLSSVPPSYNSSAQRCIFDLHWLHSVPPLPFLADGVACWTSFASTCCLSRCGGHATHPRLSVRCPFICEEVRRASGRAFVTSLLDRLLVLHRLLELHSSARNAGCVHVQ